MIRLMLALIFVLSAMAAQASTLPPGGTSRGEIAPDPAFGQATGSSSGVRVWKAAFEAPAALSEKAFHSGALTGWTENAMRAPADLADRKLWPVEVAAAAGLRPAVAAKQTEPHQVPLPASVWLLLGGLLSFAAVSRKQRG